MADREGTFVLDARYVGRTARQAAHDLLRPIGDAFRYVERTTRPQPQPQPRQPQAHPGED